MSLQRGFRRGGGLTIFLIAITILSGCGSTEKVRYRMTVEVETPRGLRSGSAVREVEQYIPPSIPMLGEDRGGFAVKGEAVTIDIGTGQTMFALLRSENGDVDYAATLPDRALRSALMPGDPNARRNEKSAELWPVAPRTYKFANADHLPMLVRFVDINKPDTIEKVDANDLAKAFGAGVRLKRITISITNDPITSGISKRFTWWSNYSGQRLDGSRSSIQYIKNKSLAHSLTQSSFTTEKVQ